MNIKLFKMAVLTVAIVILAGCDNDGHRRHAEIAAKGSEVMPFDLDQTKHIFVKIADGGRQQVIANNASDERQIKLIRQHLSFIAKQFASGDFREPALIHGSDMPGLQDLANNPEQINIAYSDIPAGGQIIYTTETHELIDAIHRWFDAQLADHGKHASGE